MIEVAFVTHRLNHGTRLLRPKLTLHHLLFQDHHLNPIIFLNFQHWTYRLSLMKIIHLVHPNLLCLVISLQRPQVVQVLLLLTSLNQSEYLSESQRDQFLVRNLLSRKNLTCLLLKRLLLLQHRGHSLQLIRLHTGKILCTGLSLILHIGNIDQNMTNAAV